MPVSTTPPTGQHFQFVLEHPQPGIDPRISTRFQLYEEAARSTLNIRLAGRSRSLIFVNRPNSRQALFKRGWRDVTDQFEREWEKDEDGAWTHTEPAPAPPPIITPDTPPPPPEDDLLDQPVKQLGRDVRAGKLDDKLDEYIAREQAAARPRGGALAALFRRQEELASDAAGAGDDDGDDSENGEE